MARFWAFALAAAALASGAAAADEVECSPSQKCPEDTPCCSPYGQCGIGAYCLGGCDPLSSFSLDSCVPEPVCKSKTYKWDDNDSIAPNTEYLGDASESDWVSSGKPLNQDGNLILTLGTDKVGTLVAHNHLMWYGKVSAKLKTSRGQGVVTAFILMSDVKDEIDFEFIGADLETAQTNYYHLGNLDYTNGGNASVSNTFENYHVYEIDWKPDAIRWSIDGKEVRVQKRSDTWNETANQYEYPQTPARVEISLWPAGLEKNGKGTIEWAGGLVDWNSEDIQKYKYYYAMFDEIKVECYDPPEGARIDGDKSYIYTDEKGLESSVKITDKDTVLKSLLGSGTDMDADYPSASGTDGPSQTSNIAVIPGMDGAGPGTNGHPNNGGSSGGSGGSGGDGGGDGSGFSQGGDSDGGSSGAAPAQSEQVLRGSLFAVLVAVLVLVTM